MKIYPYCNLYLADCDTQRDTHNCTTDNMHPGDKQFIKFVVLETLQNAIYLLFCNSFTLRVIYFFEHVGSYKYCMM